MVYDEKAKECQRRWRETHKEQIREYYLNLYKKNKEKIDERNRQYYHNNIELEHQRRKKYHDSHREEINERHRMRYHANIETQRQRGRDKHKKYRERYNENSRERRGLAKKFVIAYYSDGKNCCNCCGQNIYEFLSVDHVNGGGYKHRLGVSGDFYWWLVRQLFPDGFQILCFNCNCARGFSGRCPCQSNSTVPS